MRLNATGGDNRAKGVFIALSLALFRSLKSEKRSLLRSEMMKVKIEVDLVDQDNDSDSDTFEEKDKISVERSINQIIAKDSPSDIVRRLVKLSREICKSNRVRAKSLDCLQDGFKTWLRSI